MTDAKLFTLDDLAAEWSEDPRYVNADNQLRPYYAVATDIFELRKEQGLTQQQLAEKAQTHQSRISKLEAGDLDFRLSTLIEVAQALDAHVEMSVVKNWAVSNADFQSLLTKTVSTGSSQTTPVHVTYQYSLV